MRALSEIMISKLSTFSKILTISRRIVQIWDTVKQLATLITPVSEASIVLEQKKEQNAEDF